MSETLKTAIAVVGIDIGKNSFHIVRLDQRGTIVLRRIEISQQIDVMVGWDRGADRTSNDADVSSILPVIPQLTAWRVRSFRRAGPTKKFQCRKARLFRAI